MGLKSKILFEQGSLRITKSKLAAFGIENLLENTVWGAKGFKYNQLHAAERIHALHHPYHFYFKHGKKLLGNITLDYRLAQNGKQKLNAYYVRYFTFNAGYQTSEFKKSRRTKHSEFRKLLLSTFTSSPASKELNYGEKKELKAITYGFIDGKNLRSFNQGGNFGFETIRKFSPIIFSRKSPELLKGVRLATNREKPLVRQLLYDSYKDHSLVHFNYLFHENNYHVLEYKGEIYAGCQVHLNKWKIEGLAGDKVDKFLLPLVQHSPVRRFIDPSAFQFLTFDHLFVKPGFEHVFFGLFESLLAKYEVHIGMIPLDAQDPMQQFLNKPNKLGLAHRLLRFKPGYVMAKPLNGSVLSPDLTEKPVFISGFDIT